MKNTHYFILSILLLTSTSLLGSDPKTDFTPENRATFNTKDHPKAKGVDIRFSYPKNWEVKEGLRPNIISSFNSHPGGGLASFNLMVRDVPTELSKAEIELSLEDKEFCKQIMPSGGTLLENRIINIDGNKSAALKGLVIQEKATETKRILTWMYILPLPGKLVVFNGGLTAPPEVDPQQIAAASEAYGLIFDQMIDTVIVDSKWNK